MGGMPWEQQPPPPPQRPQQMRPDVPPQRPAYPPQQPYSGQQSPPYGRPAAQPYVPQPGGQPPQPSVPVVARNQVTGESVKVDIGQSIAAAVQKELSAALAANRDNIQVAGQRAVTRMVDGKTKPKPKPGGDDSVLDEAVEDFEGAWQSGPVTQRTLFQGMVVDMGFAIVAVLSTVLQPGVDLFDKQLWTVTGVLMAKTVVQTFISWATKAGAGTR